MRHYTAKVTFIANQEMVRNALAEGWSARAIYDQNQPKLAGISYRQFLRYIEKLITKPAAPAPGATHQSQPEGPTRGKALAEHTGIADPAALRRLIHGGKD